MYSVVKLRLPDDILMNALTDQVEAKLFEMNPKETALVAWALARSKLPSDSPLAKKIISAIYAFLQTIDKETYLYAHGSGNSEKEQSEDIDDSLEKSDCFMSQQTLAMFYWSASNICQRDSKVFVPIIKHLLTEENLTL